MIRHIVMWKLKDSSPEHAQSVLQEFGQRLELLQSHVPALLGYEIGLNVLPDAQFDLAIDSWFNNQEGLEEYLIHPVHLGIRDYLTEQAADKTVFDFHY